jgi:hypothetical protein
MAAAAPVRVGGVPTHGAPQCPDSEVRKPSGTSDANFMTGEVRALRAAVSFSKS